MLVCTDVEERFKEALLMTFLTFVKVLSFEVIEKTNEFKYVVRAKIKLDIPNFEEMLDVKLPTVEAIFHLDIADNSVDVIKVLPTS